MVNVAAKIKRLRECAFYEVAVIKFDSALLVVIAGEGYITLQNSLSPRISAVGPLLNELYTAALIATDMDAYKQKVRSLAG